jgi:NTE family protein
MILLVMSGGMGLGAYHAGVYETLLRHGSDPGWLAGSSIGSVTAALLAGSPPGKQLQVLRSFWSPGFGPMRSRTIGPHWLNWMSSIGARLGGVAGHFRPRLTYPGGEFISLYDLAPMRDRLSSLVDFDRLNSGTNRVTVATTDIRTGELLMFDTGKGDRLSMDHLLASCGFLPEFAPIEIGGRYLGDGGLSANAPIEALLEDEELPDNLFCFIVDLYSRDGDLPGSLEAALARRSDLMFGNQTWRRLEAYRRAGCLRSAEAEAGRNRRIVYLSYRAARAEAGPEKIFDYSASSIAHRWEAGAKDAELAVTRLAQMKTGLVIERIRRDSSQSSAA